MAAISSGVARLVESSITETRYCISGHLLRFGPPSCGLSPLLRTDVPRSDTASPMSFVSSLLRGGLGGEGNRPLHETSWPRLQPPGTAGHLRARLLTTMRT